MLIIDNKEYANVVLVTGVEERFEKVYGEAATMKQNGDNRYDVIGTRLIHTITLTRNPNATQKETNEFFNILADGAEFHTVTLPHDESDITYDAHIATGKRALLDIINGKYIWDDEITVEFQPISPQIRSDL